MNRKYTITVFILIFLSCTEVSDNCKSEEIDLYYSELIIELDSLYKLSEKLTNSSYTRIVFLGKTGLKPICAKEFICSYENQQFYTYSFENDTILFDIVIDTNCISIFRKGLRKTLEGTTNDLNPFTSAMGGEQVAIDIVSNDSRRIITNFILVPRSESIYYLPSERVLNDEILSYLERVLSCSNSNFSLFESN